jgi:hypothetical protein
MFVMGVTTNVSQRIVRRPVQLPAPVTFNMSQLARQAPSLSCFAVWLNP